MARDLDPGYVVRGASNAVSYYAKNDWAAVTGDVWRYFDKPPPGFREYYLRCLRATYEEMGKMIAKEEHDDTQRAGPDDDGPGSG